MVKAPWLLLTATCTETMLIEILKIMGTSTTSSQVSITSEWPNRPNIFLEFVGKPRSYMDEFKGIMDEVKTQGLLAPKTLIYCNSTEHVCDIFEAFYCYLGEDIYIDGKDREEFGCMLVGQYFRGIGPVMEQLTMEEIVKENSCIRILICTVAFGMGVQVKDIRNIYHWGAGSIPAYWQEVGRCGRDFLPSKATLCAVSHATKDESMRKMVAELRKAEKTEEPKERMCFRMAILRHFIISSMDTSQLDHLNSQSECFKLCHSQEEPCQCAHCTCCSLCARACPCRRQSN